MFMENDNGIIEKNILGNEIFDKYLKAGKIASKARELGASLVQTGVKVEEIAERVEGEIIKLGGGIAFPINISLNDVAAHYTPTQGDELVVKEQDYVKIDVGVHVDGYIGDTAVTVKLDGKDELIECSEKMLATALPLFTPKRRIVEISEVIENVAKEFGFNPVRNLTGHGLEQWNVHAIPAIPNVPVSENSPLRNMVLTEGQVVACEPFCTTGRGMVRDVDPALIFKFVRDVPVRDFTARKVLGMARDGSMPRWLGKIDKVRGTPINAIGVIGGLTMLAIFWPIEVIAQATDLFAFTTFLFVNLALIFLRFKLPDFAREFKVPVNIGNFPVLAGIAVLANLYMITQFTYDLLAFGAFAIILGWVVYEIMLWKKWIVR
jgi:methionyl aminopeptidase